jgi:hypothetical protein
METIIYILVAIIVILIAFRYCIEKCKSHEIYKLLDSYGAIQILDNTGLIAVLYRDRTIDWMRSTSLFKMIKIKEISDHFEEEYQALEDEAHCKIVKDWRTEDATNK